MWRTMYKLAKSFSDLPGPRRVADSFKIKVDKFKQHLPILTTICNPGIKDRHWQEVSVHTNLTIVNDVSQFLNMIIVIDKFPPRDVLYKCTIVKTMALSYTVEYCIRLALVILYVLDVEFIWYLLASQSSIFRIDEWNFIIRCKAFSVLK